MPAKPIPGTAATTRLRKLECDAGCGYIARVSRAAMLRGLPGCPCGGTLEPATLEDAQACAAAGLMDLSGHGEACEYARQLDSILHGQAGHVQRGRAVQQPEGLAYERLVRERIRSAKASQLAALEIYRPGARPAEPMPF